MDTLIFSYETAILNPIAIRADKKNINPSGLESANS
jgi:hypothetical protein